MRYIQILLTAKSLATKNPIFWLFGLALYGGFNLYLINFFTLFKHSDWNTWPAVFEAMFKGAAHGYALLLVAGVVLFAVLNIIKMLFIVFAHNELHKIKESECDLCVRVAQQFLPYTQWFKYIVLASSITVIITSSIALTTGTIVARYAYDNAAVVMINVLFIALITCAVGVWNLFTGYFVVLHGMNFSRASKAALDLLVLRLQKVVEFMVILSALYSAAVFVGNAFIHIWQQGMLGTTDFTLRMIALVFFALWFAANNAFFNLAFLVFFESMVKSVRAPKDIADGHLQPNILH